MECAQLDRREIDRLGIERVLKRGSGEILAEQERNVLVRDRISGAYFLACEDAEIGRALLQPCLGQDCKLLMVTDLSLGNELFAQFGFSDKLVCVQVAYYGEKPASKAGLSVRTAELDDLPMLLAHYGKISPEELEEVVRREAVLLGYAEGQLVGFVGEHLEGSMGLLYVFPEYRRRGYGAALQTELIARTMEKGEIPFGQVEEGNHASFALQKKLGMTQSDNRMVWMWK